MIEISILCLPRVASVMPRKSTTAKIRAKKNTADGLVAEAIEAIEAGAKRLSSSKVKFEKDYKKTEDSINAGQRNSGRKFRL